MGTRDLGAGEQRGHPPHPLLGRGRVGQHHNPSAAADPRATALSSWKILAQGVNDMVRISDARMSGTVDGTVVLHTAPEAAAGGPIALVQEGDTIDLDVAGRRLHLDVSDDELARRRAVWRPVSSGVTRGYARLFLDHVLQADRGADFDFLVDGSGAPVVRGNH